MKNDHRSQGKTNTALVIQAPKVAQGASSKNGFLLCPSLDYPWTSNSIVDLNDLSNGILPNVLFAPRKSPVRFQPSSLTNASVLDFGLNWVGRAQNAKPIGALMEYSMSLYKGEEKVRYVEEERSDDVFWAYYISASCFAPRFRAV